jgi:hypothetical protein
MIELVIAFLMSIGWINAKNVVTVKDNNDSTFGIVVIDETTQRTGTVSFDEATKTFILQ